MSTSSRTTRRNVLEAEAAAAEDEIERHVDIQRCLSAAIKSAELYMQALTLSDTPSVRKRLDAKVKGLLTKAESLKSRQSREQTQPGIVNTDSRIHPVATRELTTRENIILLEGSKLNGAIFKPWKGNPTTNEFELADGQDPYIDPTDFSFSATQLESFAGWERPSKALSLFENGDARETGLITPSMFTRRDTVDLVQDVTSDCSVVASLCAGVARARKSHHRILRAVIFPYDEQNERAMISRNGKYVFRFHFNGCWRRVEIDDRLPTSRTKRTLHVVDRSDPGLLWPALIEKAYLKIRGGYDFPGSNSATDVAVISGWIPQQLFLHDDNVEPAQIWDELLTAFNKGDMLLTLGTGKLGRREQKQLGLAPDHDYAVLDMQVNDGIPEMLIKNPWADGEVWKGAARRRPNPGHEVEEADGIPLSLTESQKMIPGTFWMDFDHIFQYFQNAYVNWNPSLFEFREDLHFVLDQHNNNGTVGLLVSNPQFAVNTTQGGETWLLLSRHFRTGDYTSANNGKNGYISLYVFENNGKRIFSAATAKNRGPFVDSPNTLIRFTSTTRQPLTVVVLCQDMPLGKHNFTLSVLANSKVILKEAQQQFHAPMSLSAAWTRSVSGGNSDSPHYLQNPQFSLSVPGKCSIALVLNLDLESTQLTQTDVAVKVAVVRSDGSRVTKLRRREVAITSGDYRRGSAVVEHVLDKGSYTIICSTFEEGQYLKFSLDLYTELSQTPLRLVPIHSERSGKLSLRAHPAIFDEKTRKVIAPLGVGSTTSAVILASLSHGDSSSLFKISLEQGQGPNRISLTSSADEESEYHGISHGLRLQRSNLTPALSSMAAGGLWLVAERPELSLYNHAVDHVVQIEILSEEHVTLGQWAPLDD